MSLTMVGFIMAVALAIAALRRYRCLFRTSTACAFDVMDGHVELPAWRVARMAGDNRAAGYLTASIGFMDCVSLAVRHSQPQHWLVIPLLYVLLPTLYGLIASLGEVVTTDDGARGLGYPDDPDDGHDDRPPGPAPTSLP